MGTLFARGPLAWVDELYVQSTGFVLGPDGRILVSVCSRRWLRPGMDRAIVDCC